MLLEVTVTLSTLNNSLDGITYNASLNEEDSRFQVEMSQLHKNRKMAIDLAKDFRQQSSTATSRQGGSVYRGGVSRNIARGNGGRGRRNTPFRYNSVGRLDDNDSSAEADRSQTNQLRKLK